MRCKYCTNIFSCYIQQLSINCPQLNEYIFSRAQMLVMGVVHLLLKQFRFPDYISLRISPRFIDQPWSVYLSQIYTVDWPCINLRFIDSPQHLALNLISVWKRVSYSELITGYKRVFTFQGPPADAPEVENFKTFWGEKCSLRRFQDGSFHEAVLWGEPKQSQGERRLIPGKICKYLLSRHFGLEKENIICVAKQAECILHHTHFKMDFE